MIIRKISLYRHSFVLMMAALLAGALGYLFHVVVARQMSVAQYGELQSLLALFNSIVIFAGWLSYYVVKHVAVFAEAGDVESSWCFLKWFNRRVMIYTAWVLLVFVMSSLALGKYLQLTSLWGLVVVGLAGALWVMAMPGLGVLTGWKRFLSIGAIHIVGAGMKVLAGAVLVTLAPLASVVSAAFLVSSVGVWALFHYVSQKRLNIVASFGVGVDWREKYFAGGGFKRRTVMIFSYAILMASLFGVDLLVVRHLFSPDASGYYGALSLLGKIVLWINLSVITVVLPSAVACGHKGKKVGWETISGAYLLIVGISVFVVTVYYWFGGFILQSFFGDRYVHLGGDLWLFGVMSLCFSLLQLESNFAFARDDWRILYVLLVSIGLTVLSVYLFKESIRGVALGIIAALIIGYAGVLFLNTWGRKSF